MFLFKGLYDQRWFGNTKSHLVQLGLGQSLTLLAPGGGTKCPDPFHNAIAVFFSRKRVFLLFDFYYFGVRQFLVKKNFIFFTRPPSEGGTKKTKKFENWS